MFSNVINSFIAGPSFRVVFCIVQFDHVFLFFYFFFKYIFNYSRSRCADRRLNLSLVYRFRPVCAVVSSRRLYRRLCAVVSGTSSALDQYTNIKVFLHGSLPCSASDWLVTSLQLAGDAPARIIQLNRSSRVRFKWTFKRKHQYLSTVWCTVRNFILTYKVSCQSRTCKLLCTPCVQIDWTS